MRLFAPGFAIGLLALSGVACSVGSGEGGASGTLNVPDCWSGHFTLSPDYFAGIPYRRSLELRVQEGGDYSTFSDGLHVLVRDIDAILPNPAQGYAGRLGQPLAVQIPPGVTPPGVPIVPDPDPAIVELAVYLQRTCKTQNVALYAGTVSLNANGTCDAIDTPVTPCSQSATAPVAGAPTADSTITFNRLFNGLPDELDAGKRLTDASFDVYLADPREICPGGLGPPPPCRGHLQGSFRFTFERGRPAQRFP